MDTTHDGGPAFPFYRPEMRAAGGRVTRAHDEQDGMSLRDYFAAKSLQGICACSDDQVETDTDQVDFIAGRAYAYADAMLRARAQSSPQSPGDTMRAHLATWGDSK